MAMQRREKKSTALPSMCEGGEKNISYHVTQHTTRGHFAYLYPLNSANIFHVQNPGEKLLERNSIELYASLPHGFLSHKSDFSQHHPPRAVPCRFNGPSPRCRHPWEQNLGTVDVVTQAARPQQLTPIQPRYIMEPCIMGKSVKN